MYFVTNRRIFTNREGFDAFGDTPNPKGGNELRLVKVTKRGQGIDIDLLMDKLPASEVRSLASRHKLAIDTGDTWYASLKVACEVFEQANSENKNILFFVHGYNNDVADVFKTATEIEKRYGVIVVPFTWPANGGGALSGTAAYLDDKKDARASTNALDSFVLKISQYHDMLTACTREEAMKKAEARYPDNPGEARESYTRMLDRACKVKLSLACHSMGNYLLKYALIPSTSALRELVFDNVALIAADTNNEDHDLWLEHLEARNRIFVVINEDDSALGWSRRKPGKQQLPRLGHYLKNLSARNAHYIDVTEAKYVGSDHGYFKGNPVEKNTKLQRVFRDIFGGRNAENGLTFRVDRNAYEV